MFSLVVGKPVLGSMPPDAPEVPRGIDRALQHDISMSRIKFDTFGDHLYM